MSGSVHSIRFTAAQVRAIRRRGMTIAQAVHAALADFRPSCAAVEVAMPPGSRLHLALGMPPRTSTVASAPLALVRGAG